MISSRYRSPARLRLVGKRQSLPTKRQPHPGIGSAVSNIGRAEPPFSGWSVSLNAENILNIAIRGFRPLSLVHSYSAVYLDESSEIQFQKPSWKTNGASQTERTLMPQARILAHSAPDCYPYVPGDIIPDTLRLGRDAGHFQYRGCGSGAELEPWKIT
jgi:hypothetical protein